MRRCFKQPNPLFVVQRNGEAAQTVDTDASFFANTKFERPGAARSSLFFHFREFCFEFFVRWLGHGASCVWMDWKQDYTMRFDLAECGLYSARDFA